MTDRHREYLKTRRFDPDRLERDWGLLGTGNLGPFAHRIIIPIVQGGKLVCFQGRDISGKAASKYKSCPDDKAVLPIKSCLYGLDKVRGDSVVVTEGPTKVWRLGSGSVCTFGATVTSQQVKTLTRFRRVFILFDEDEAGADGADKLSRQLAVLGSHCCIVTAGVKDVAELSDREAAELMAGLIK
jgi:DNA primase